MKIGTILFTWHRSTHTRKVLDALSKNDVLPEVLYIFQDGVNEKTDSEEWQKVNQLIKNVHFCETKVCVSDINKGCARSIVSGINYVLQECDAVIVLEDDCVPDRQFMRFIISALETYKNEDKVYCVSGYGWKVVLSEQKEFDAYFNRRSSSSGWATWKDKWAAYKEDYNIINKIKKDSAAKERLRIWGNDLEAMLAGNIHGTCDAWDVFWALNIIKKGGYCLSPYKTLIHNIGFDGSGLHSGSDLYMQDDTEEWEAEYKPTFLFPKRVESTKECEEEFQFLFGGKTAQEKARLYRELLIRWIRMKQEEREAVVPQEMKGSVASWGKGEILDVLLDELKGRVTVDYIVESKPSRSEYKGIPIITIDQVPKEIKNIIVIPYFDMEIIAARVKKIGQDIKLWGIDGFIP